MLAYDSLPYPDDRFELKEVIGTGVCSKVYRAFDKEGNRFVAIKCQRYENEMVHYINEEYRVLRDYSNHPNLPSFYGVYRKKFTTAQPDEIWFVLELCEGGSIIDIIRSLQTINKRVTEEHLSFILREVAKALLHLHDNKCIHRDIRGSNILMTKDGEIKLCDFGLSADVKSTGGRRSTFIGSPSWMAPEVVACSKGSDRNNIGYESRAEVWALGITAIELADGKPPFADMHPTRAMFQILRNPPPTLYRQSLWTQNFNDFIAECLEKNPDHRPFLAEIMEHPFFTELPENDYHFSQELKHFLNDIESINFPMQSESLVYQGYIKNHDNKMEKMYVEDLAAIEPLHDDTILEEIKNKVRIGETYSFIGDILLSMNPNKKYPIYDRKFHNRYMYKSRSDNAPHIFSVADSAYQDMLHHEEQQFILFSGETYSGKTTNTRLCFEHLVLMGEGNAGIVKRVNNALQIVSTLTHSGTPQNHDSTRCAMQIQMTFGTTGKLSGLIFWIYLLEKLRVSTTDMSQPNFHIFYYFYDTMVNEERLKDFHLEGGRTYRYLRIPEVFEKSKLNHVRDDPVGNVLKFKDFEQALLALEISQDTLDSIYRILAAILILGDVRFKESDHDRKAALVDPRTVKSIAELLRVDEKKFQWSLMNYCVIIKGNVEKRRHSPDEARDARDVLAGNLYSRLVDYIVNTINQKLALNRAIFGDKHSIVLMDLFGFECHKRNNIDQIFVNSLNEQMQYHFNQRCFVWEMIEQEEEHVPVTKLNFYDNKIAVDHLMSTQKGLFHIFDDASRGQYSFEFITEAVNNRKSPYMQRFSNHEFTVCHYSGKINYDTRDLVEKNRDFLPPEMIETLRSSEENIMRICFTNPLSKSGNLTMEMASSAEGQPKQAKKSAWKNALMSEKAPLRRMNSLSRGQYSQIHKMRTLSSIFRATSLEILKSLSIVSNSSGVHFVRCMRSDLDYREFGFNEDVVRQQMRALAILDTARARQKGFSVRIPFNEFLRRYKFLAFDFDENVEVTKDNCRLLLVRLKMEGWLIGNSKVFLKYYNEEFLARLYETQVKKIIKVQSMMRAFLAKRNVESKTKPTYGRISKQPSSVNINKPKEFSNEEAVIKIQTAFRGYQIRKIYGPLIDAKTGKIDMATAKFIEPYAIRWKRKSIFQILLQYRSIRHLDLVNFAQQIHIYNQRMVHGMTATSRCIVLNKIDPKQTSKEQLGPIRRAVWKMPFRLDEIPFFDTSMLCEPADLTFFTTFEEEIEPWDAPLRRRNNVSSQISSKLYNYPRRESHYSEIGSDDGVLIMEPFSRDPTMPLKKIRARKYESPRPSLPNILDEPVTHTFSSPTPYSPPNFSHLKSKFSGDTNGNIETKVFKKRAAPKPPSDDHVFEQRPPSTSRKGPAPQPFQQSVPLIREMESYGKSQLSTTDENDEPPFNFQAMLRKTKYNRNSMKRNNENRMSLPQEDQLNNNTVVFNSRSKSIDDITSERSPKQKPKTNSYEMLSTSKSSGGRVTPDRNHNVVEIAPGIIVEGDGYCEDL